MIFSGWRRSPLAVAWEFATAGVLWRLLPSKEGFFVLEDRDVDAKTVTFARVEMRTGAVLWKDVTVDEPWWVSIELAAGDAVILHGFGTPDLPDHRKIFVLDAQTGALRWSNTELALLWVRGEHVYAAKQEFERLRYFALDIRSGTLLRDVDASELDALRTPETGVPSDLVVFPQPCRDLRELDGGLRRLVASMAGKAAPGLVEVLSLGESEAVAVYVATGADPSRPSYTQKLAVRHRGRTVYEDVMNTNASVSIPDGFFASADRLYYIKDQRILRALAFHGS